MNQMERITLIPEFLKKLMKNNPNIIRIFALIVKLNHDLHDLYVNIADNNAQNFLKIKKLCEKLKSDPRYKIPLSYYINNLNNLNENEISTRLKFFISIYNSIVKPMKDISQEKPKLFWPTNENVGAIKDERSILFESLISYTLELQKIDDIDINNPEWTKICKLYEPDALLKEFVNTKKISMQTVFNFISIINAQLLTNLFESNWENHYEYCNKNNIISFFNNFITIDFDSSWLKIVQNATKDYPADFLISIPSFYPIDILSLIINPLTKSNGCFFNENEVPPDLINIFYNMFYYILTNPKCQTFEFVHEQIINEFVLYINKNYSAENIEIRSNDFDASIDNILKNEKLKSIHNLCKKIRNVAVICNIQENKESIQLDFSDVLNIDFNNFNKFIKSNPSSAYYIAQFPAVKSNLDIISKLCTYKNIRKNNMPLALFAYRIVSRMHKILFQIPARFPISLSEKIQTLVSNLLNTNKKIDFSNLVGFLLIDPPQFITDTQYSQYVRNILINLMTSHNDETLLREIMNVITEILPTLISIIGSSEWNEVINQELEYKDSKDKSNDVVNLLSNPWKFTLEKIKNNFEEDYNNKNNEVKKSLNLILNLIRNLSSKQSIKKLKTCVEEDVTDYQDKRVQQHINDERKNEKESNNIKNMIKNWNCYSKFVKSYLSLIQPLPTATNIKSLEYKSIDTYGDFYRFFSSEKNSLPCKNEEVYAISPKSNKITINYKKSKKEISVIVQVYESMALFRNDDKTIKYEIIGGEVKKLKIPYDRNVEKYREVQMNQIINYYNEFNSYYQKVDKNEDMMMKYNYKEIVEKIGQVDVSFGTKNINDFINYLNKLYKKYESFDEDDFYGKSNILDDVKNDIYGLEQFRPISFHNEKVIIPHKTQEFVGEELATITSSSINNLIKSKFGLFSEEFRRKYDFINDPNGLFNKILQQSSKFLMKLENNEIPNIEMDKIEASDSLLVPSIYLNKNQIEATIKEIQINIENLLFGVDVKPFQIKLCNYTNKKIRCTFNQNKKELPLPEYRNETGYLVIEIPVESMCKNVFNLKKDEMEKSLNDVENIFMFDGTILLNTEDNPDSLFKINYSISLHYISLTVFIQIANGHSFAIKNGKAKVVPFIAGPKTKICFKKFTNRYIENNNLINSIVELNDNTALKPDFDLSIDKNDNRICNIETSFADSTSDTSHLSMNYEFTTSKDNIIPVELKINTFPSNNNLYLAIYSDNDKNFVENDGSITIGNIARKVYFFIGYLNIGNEPISPSNIELTSSDYHVQAKFNEYEIKEKILPNKYGSIITFFEVRYCGPFAKESKTIKATIKVNIGETTKTLDFTYIVNLLQIDAFKLYYNKKCDTKYYINKHFENVDISKLDDKIWNEKNRIFISPYGYVFNNTDHKHPFIEYNAIKGSFISYTSKSLDNLEVLEFILKKKEFKIRLISEVESYLLNYPSDITENVTIDLFARLENQPETYFPLFCPNEKIANYFDVRKCTADVVDIKFDGFYTGLFSSNEKRSVNGTFDYLFDSRPSSFNNFSTFINAIGKNYNIVKFNKLINEVKNFTNFPHFDDHYYDALNQLAGGEKELLKNQKFQFYSFISALNEIALYRYEDLQASCFYLTLPIEFEKIKSQQQLLLSKIVKEKENSNCPYVKDFQEQTKEENEFEDKNKNNFEKNRYKITSVLKWCQSKGLKESNIDELNEYKCNKISLKCNIKPILKNSVSPDTSSNIIKLLKFPKKITLLSIYDLFNDIYSFTNMLPFALYTLQKNNASLNNVKELLGQIISIYNWQKSSEECFPFSSFKAKFLLEFKVMIARLLKSKVHIEGFEKFNNLVIDNFIEKPSPLPVDMKISIFKQLGKYNENPNKKEIKDKDNTASDETITVKVEPDKKKEEPDEKKEEENEKEEEPDNKKVIPTIKHVYFEEIIENSKEIPDTDFIQYLIQEMRQKNIEKIEYIKSNTSHIPKSIQKKYNIGIDNKRINPFIEASMKLSDVLINKINNDNNIIDNSNTIYSSILVDCSSTLSLSQKAALVTLVIALGNSLTAIKIPYSIILFCESNFQFILKQVDENHDLIHFEKLLDTITIRRRMSDMSSAILMADEKIKSKDKKRINHAMFVLTDGLLPKIGLIDQWKSKILNNNKRSILFYFLDVLTEESDEQFVHQLWDNFQDKISKSLSINEVVYSKASSIYNGDSIFVDSFIQILNKFIGESKVDIKIIPPEFSHPISKIPKEVLDNIIDNIFKGIIDDRTVFAQYSFPNEVLEKFTDFDLILSSPNPLVSFTAGIEDIDIKIISKFLSKLISASHSLFDNLLLQDISTLVFPPNKASQYTPSEKGNIFYFPGLMKYILTQGQDSKIFLEKKAGLIRSYSVFIVIDNTTSCFNANTYSHSFQTILSLLYPLSKIDIPSLNIIIATSKGPIILCSENPSMLVLEDNSLLWVSIFSNLFGPHSIKSNLYSALISVYQMKIQQNFESSLLFVLTDGFYGFDERNEYNSVFNILKSMNTIPIIVGIGMNPKFINLLTDKAVWSPNAKMIWTAILFLFDKEVQHRSSNIKTCFSFSQFNNQKVNELEKNFNMNKMFPDLFNELNKVVRKIATYKNFYNKDQSNNPMNSNKFNNYIENSESSEVALKNPIGPQYDLGKKDYYKGVKLLIVMCWDHTCSVAEDPKLSEEVLRNGADENNNISVVNALIYYGIETYIVKNYIDAINEITKGIYSQVWIICGRMDGSMPGNNDPESNHSNLIDQFIDCLIIYWNKGGGLVFWTDNYPLTAEVNKFLKKAKFKVKKPNSTEFINVKVDFHIGGDYPGKEMMIRNDKLIEKTFVSKNADESEGYEKALFNHELYEIYEGITIASAIKGEEKDNEWKDYTTMTLNAANEQDIKPFKAFSMSSSGGFSSLYYMSPLDIDCGDIVIDCGFSKLFFELTKEGIDRYVKNIAIWMLQLEKKDIKYGSTKDARLVVPPKFEFKINYKLPGIEFHKFDIMKDIDLVFLVDGTGSMKNLINAVCNCCKDIASQCYNSFPGREFRFGAVIYRDSIVYIKYSSKNKDKVDLCQLTNDINIFKRFFGEIKSKGGGGDGPEDWVSGYDYLLNKINWKNNSIKIVIHMCDAGGHGKSFTCNPLYSEYYYQIPKFSGKKDEKENEEIYNQIQESEDIKFRGLVKEAAEKNLNFYCLNYNEISNYCFHRTKELFKTFGGKKFIIKNQYKSEDYRNEKNVSQLAEQIKTVVKEAVDSSVAVFHYQEETKYEKDCNLEFEEDYNNTENKYKDEIKKKKRKYRHPK